MQSVQNQIPLLKAIAKGIQWQQYLDGGRFKSVQELAKHLGKERAVVSHTLQDKSNGFFCETKRRVCFYKSLFSIADNVRKIAHILKNRA